ncbi:MAG TPA: nicotinamide riboside transporter PnuC [Thermoanaerobaculia bacterium]|nr:nicotinamide riboside transporter PnuC [Thermoanaerobaculia bacterium]
MGEAGAMVTERGALARWLADWTLFERLWLLVFTAINLYVFFVVGDTLLGLVTSLTGMMTVVLVAKGKISNYFFGVVNVTLYAYLSWRNLYWGEVMLNLGYFLPMNVVGFWLWSRHRVGGEGGDDVEVKLMSGRQRAGWVAVTAVAVVVYGMFLDRLGGNLPYWDSASTVMSVIAMFLMVRRVTEQWVLWIAVNVVSIYMWGFALSEGGTDVSMVVMWSAYLVNSVYGLWNWVRLARADGGGQRLLID